jgi:ABC-type molybdate transport system substrate-binding protein
MGVIKASPNAISARRFMDFVLGKTGRAVLRKYGYTFNTGKREEGRGKSE